MAYVAATGGGYIGAALHGMNSAGLAGGAQTLGDIKGPMLRFRPGGRPGGRWQCLLRGMQARAVHQACKMRPALDATCPSTPPSPPALPGCADGPATALAWPEVLLYLLGTFSSVQEVADEFTPQAWAAGRLQCTGWLALLGAPPCLPAAGREVLNVQPAQSAVAVLPTCRPTKSSPTMPPRL